MQQKKEKLTAAEDRQYVPLNDIEWISCGRREKKSTSFKQNL